MFDELIGKVKELESRLDSGSTQRWATVTQASPLRVRFDGDAAALLVTPINLVGTLIVGDRVRAELNTGQLYITNRLGGIDLSTVGNTTGNAATATNLSTVRTNWNTNGTISAVVGQLAWKNYGNSHTIFDASNGTAPDGTAHSNTNAEQAWGATYPTLMGFNGTYTYGVRVDSARVVDAHTHAVANLTDFATVIGGSLTSNNYYEKYADGQLICRGTTTFATGSQAYTWTFPVAFVGQLPQVFHSHHTTAPESLHASHSSLALSSVIIQHNRSTAGSTTMYYSAMGRWK